MPIKNKTELNFFKEKLSKNSNFLWPFLEENDLQYRVIKIKVSDAITIYSLRSQTNKQKISLEFNEVKKNLSNSSQNYCKIHSLLSLNLNMAVLIFTDLNENEIYGYLFFDSNNHKI